MFWDSVEAVKERTLQQMVNDPNTPLDDILNHDYCFQELRLESKYLVEYFTRPDILNELLNRSLFFRPDPETEPLLQYKVSPRSFAILAMGCRPVNNAILGDKELVDKLINYLKPSEDSYANDITTGFYKRLIISMLNTFDTSENAFFDVLEKSNFMELCFASIDFGAIAELIVRIPSHCTNLDFQKRVFDWYAKDGVAQRLLKLYTKDASMEVLENAGFIWAEINEMQLRHIDTADAFINALNSEEIVKGLTEQAFKSLENSSPLLINYIAPVLVSFVESNRLENEPGYKAFPDLYMREPTLDLADPEYKFQSIIASHSKTIVQAVLKAWEAPVSKGLTLTAVSCLRLIRALTNTNHPETHVELAKVFNDPETSIFKFLDYAAENPTSSICNNHIMAIIAHILFSNTEKQHVLIDSLFKSKPTIIEYIIDVLEKYGEKKENEQPEAQKSGVFNWQHLARQSFFLKIGEFINTARNETCERSVYLSELIQGQEKAEKWQDVTNSILHSFTESNKTYSLNSSQFNQSTNDTMGKIDEIVGNTERDIQELTLLPRTLDDADKKKSETD